MAKSNLSFRVWSHGGSTFKKKRTQNSDFPRPAETDPYISPQFKSAIQNTLAIVITYFDQTQVS